MKTLIVLGNGESRKVLSYEYFEDLKKYCHVYGCNALYRDFSPEVLVSVDLPMIREVRGSGYKGRYFYSARYAQKKYMTDGAWKIEHKGYASGPTAIYIGIALHPEIDIVYLVGHDLYSRNGMFNNVYRDTLNYAKSGTKVTIPSAWIRELGMVISFYKSIKFVRVTDQERNPIEWEAYVNVFNINYAQFIEDMAKVKAESNLV